MTIHIKLQLHSVTFFSQFHNDLLYIASWQCWEMLSMTFIIGACFSHLCFPPEISEIAYTKIDVCNICVAAKISSSDAQTVRLSKCINFCSLQISAH